MIATKPSWLESAASCRETAGVAGRHLNRLPLPDGASTRRGLVGRQRLLADGPVDLREHRLERRVDVGGVQRRGLDEREAFPLGERGRALPRDGAEVREVGLVADEHDGGVGVGVVAELLEPPLHVLEGRGLGHVVDQERAHRAAVVGARDRPVALLPGRVPDLRFDRLAFHLMNCTPKEGAM
jgi:hypothetical protein